MIIQTQTRHDSQPDKNRSALASAFQTIATHLGFRKDGAGGEPTSDPANAVEESTEVQSQATEGGIVTKLQGQLDAMIQLVGELKKQLEQATSPATLDSLLAKRQGVIDVARALVKDFKADGLTEKAIKLKVIEKVLPFAEGVKTDSVDDARIDAQYEAAAHLAREKAALRSDSASGAGTVRIDEAAIAKKRADRLNMMNPQKEGN